MTSSRDARDDWWGPEMMGLRAYTTLVNMYKGLDKPI